MGIFVYNIQLGGSHRQVGVILPGLVEKFIVDIQLEHISRLQTGIPFGPCPIALDPFDADILLGQRSRKQGYRLAEKAVQPLPGIVLSYGNFLHNRYTVPGLDAKCSLILWVNSSAGL